MDRSCPHIASGACSPASARLTVNRAKPAPAGSGACRRCSPMLQAAAWSSTRLRTLSWPRTQTRRMTARLIHVRESTLHHFASAALQATDPAAPAHAGGSIQRFLRSTLLRPSRPSSCPAAATAALRLRYVTPNYLAEPHQRLVAVIALVGHHLFDPRALRLHRFNLFGRHDQRLRQRGRITVRCILHRHRDDGGRVHVDPVLGLVSQVRSDRPSSSRSSRSGSCGDFRRFDATSCSSETGRTEPAPPASASPHPASANRRMERG